MTNGNIYVSLRSGMGRVEWTRQHTKGHLCWQAAHANCLRHAAAHRHLKEHWLIYMDRAKKVAKIWHMVIDVAVTMCDKESSTNGENKWQP